MACVACHEAFDEHSDIVVCPDCGAPHHRECWKAEGHCACEEKHGDGYTWQPEKMYFGLPEAVPDEQSASEGDEEMVLCQNCGRKVKKSEKYCQFCGYYIYEQEDPFDRKNSEHSTDELEELFPFDQAELIDGVPAGDVKRFVGQMWIYYIPRFIRMKRRKFPVSFNFTAFLTHGLWFISRGMYATGISMIVTVVATSVCQGYLAQLSEGVSQGKLAVLSLISLMLSSLEFVMMLVSGLFGNYFYMKYCARKIKKINARATLMKATAEEFNRELEQSGGVSFLPVLSIGICFLAILYILDKGILF